MASIRKEVLTSGTIRWRARYRAAGKQHERAFPRRVDAERWIAEQTGAVAAGTHSEPARGRVTVGEWAEQWLAAQAHLKASTRYRYRSLLTNSVLPTWGRVRLGQVEHAAVAAWVGRLSASGLAPATVRQAHRVLSLALGYAVADRRLSANPAVGVPLPRTTRPAQRFLTRTQVTALADAAGADGDALLVLAHCGLRFGELTALRVVDLDLTRRRLRIAASASEVGGKLVFSETKTRRVRWVPVPGFLLEPLSGRAEGRPLVEPLFTNRDGGHLRLRTWRRHVFDPSCRAVGITDLSPHDLRHTAASLAVAAGANVKMVQQMLGHASAAMTLDVYAGLFEDDLDALARRLDDAHREQAAEDARKIY